MSGTLGALVWGGAACAVLDGCAAQRSVRAERHPDASHLAERRQRRAGRAGFSPWLAKWGTGPGVFGALHGVAFTAAAIFNAACHLLPYIARAYLVSGPLYGIAVYLVMNRIVVPLSARPPRPRSQGRRTSRNWRSICSVLVFPLRSRLADWEYEDSAKGIYDTGHLCRRTDRRGTRPVVRLYPLWMDGSARNRQRPIGSRSPAGRPWDVGTRGGTSLSDRAQRGCRICHR